MKTICAIVWCDGDACQFAATSKRNNEDTAFVAEECVAFCQLHAYTPDKNYGWTWARHNLHNWNRRRVRLITEEEYHISEVIEENVVTRIGYMAK